MKLRIVNLNFDIRKDSMLNSTRVEEELEELRWQKSLMEDDLQYKTQTLSEKIRETHELSSELERIRAENERLRSTSTGKNVPIVSSEKLPRSSEKENNANLELEKARSKIFSLEKQIEAMKVEHRTREQDQAYL